MLNFLNLDNTGKGYLKGWELLKQRLNKAESKTVPNVPFYCVSLIHISAKKQTKKRNHTCVSKMWNSHSQTYKSIKINNQ